MSRIMLEEIPQARWETAVARQKVIGPLASKPGNDRLEIELAAKLLNLRRAYVYRLLAAYRRRPQTSTLLPQPRGRRDHSRFLDTGVETIIQSTIDSLYLKRERPPVAELVRQIRSKCNAETLTPPDYETVKRRLNALDIRQITKARSGSRRAKELFGPAIPQSVQDDPLGLVQIDHTLVDVILVDERSRMPIGRPWLTLVIDVATRTVPGFYLTLEPPSALSVALAITHAVLPKDSWLASLGVTLPWPIAGIPDRLHMDNGSDFHSKALSRGAEEYGIELVYRPPGAPHFGGHIERLIGTFMGKVHLLPGTTFSDVHQRGQYDSEGKASMTLPELERWLALEVLGVYHASVHSAINRPPQAAWAAGIIARKAPIRMPADQKRFFIDFLPGEKRMIRRDGIRLFSIHYWDNTLSGLAGRSESPVLIKYDPRDLSRIYFLDENNQYWPIPYGNLGLPAISLWEHRRATKYLREQGRKLVDQKCIFETIEAQRAIVEGARKSTRQRREIESRSRSTRAVAAAATNTPSPFTLETAPRSTGDNFEDLPAFPVEEWV